MLLDSIQDAESASEIKEISRDFLPTIRSAISSVSGMLQDIMEVGSDTKITPEDSDTTCLIESALNDVFRIHLDAEIRISYELFHTHKASIDTLKVQRVFCNIVSNAVQAIKSNGELWFRTREIFSESGEMLVEICIGNSGSFISSESVSKVFDAFFTENKRGGTGLGLAIAQKIVHAHGGKIWCVSEVSSLFPEGMVEFLFTLPVSKTLCNVHQHELPENSKAISDFLRVFSDKETFDDSSEDRLLLSERLISIFFRTYSRKIKILIVDDEALYRNALRSMLQKSTEIPTSPFSTGVSQTSPVEISI
jgi:light-regulated signal transduction histidine kinase (bacteriophytochrome)